MYEITNVVQGNTITYVETLKYVKLAPNGSYISADRIDAEGIAVNNNFYKLDEIAIKEIDFAKHLFQLNQKVDMLTDCVFELSILISQISSEVDYTSTKHMKTQGIVNAYLNSVIQGLNTLDEIPDGPVNWKHEVEELYNQHNLSDEEEEEATADNGEKRNPTPRRAKPIRRK